MLTPEALLRCLGATPAPAPPGGRFTAEEAEEASAPDTPVGWAELGARAVEVHSGWPLAGWLGQAAGDLLRAADARGRTLASREMEFALEAATLDRRRKSHGEWTSPEWRQARRGGG